MSRRVKTALHHVLLYSRVVVLCCPFESVGSVATIPKSALDLQKSMIYPSQSTDVISNSILAVLSRVAAYNIS